MADQSGTGMGKFVRVRTVSRVVFELWWRNMRRPGGATTGIQMRVTLVFWFSTGLWGVSLCIPMDQRNVNGPLDIGDPRPQLDPKNIANNKPPRDASTDGHSLERVIDDIFKSIEKYQEISPEINNNSPLSNDKNTFVTDDQENTKHDCKDSTRVSNLENLVDSIFTSIKNYKESTKNNKNTLNRNYTNTDLINNQPLNNLDNFPFPYNCTCVKYHRCNDSSGSRLSSMCPEILDVCCYNVVATEELTTNKNLVTSSKLPDLSTTEGTPPKPWPIAGKCGHSHILESETKIEQHRPDNNDKAAYGEFPWMVWIGDSSLTYLCGGSLIHPKVVLTAAHCISGKENLVIRAGEWNTRAQVKEESVPHQEVKVKETMVHVKFNNGSLANDPALLILETPVELSDRVNIVCLPDNLENVNGSQCIASGWGNQVKTNESEEDRAVLKRVGALPIVAREECQESLRKTKLGEHFKLHETFICAGGTPGKDTCKGDGGSPLVCPSKEDSSVFVQVGIVAWGISCGTDTPGVYVNVPHFVSWIQDALKFKGITHDNV